MAIERKYKGSKFIDEPGEYVVSIKNLEVGKSTKGDQMLTVTFATDDERTIKSFFVRKLAFHIRQLTDLKLSAGLTETEDAMNLVGKRVGIAVDEQEPNEKGQVFMRITGFGKEADVDLTFNARQKEAQENRQVADTDAIPF